MKKIDVRSAVGMRLCHDITEIRPGFKGPAFRRNHVISADDIEHLLDIGKRYVFVWDDSAEEIHEDECAGRMAAALRVPGGHYEGPSEGKMVLVSDSSGLFVLDRELLSSVNGITDITVTSIPSHYPVKPGDRIASMRIVPLATSEKNILAFEKLCQDRKLFEIFSYRHLKTGIVITGSEIYHGRRKDRFENVLRAKLKNYPGEVLGATVCDDSTDMIVSAAEKYIGAGADFLIFTGGMSVDPDDVTPSAVRQLGADILSHGVPAQPGNMTMLAYLGDVTVLGVPGAAVSLPVTVLDVMLPQIFTGVRFTSEDLKNIAEGGLCMQCRTCHYPCCTFGRY